MKYPTPTGNPNDLLKSELVFNEIKKNIINRLSEEFNTNIIISDSMIKDVLSQNIKSYFQARTIYNASAAGALDKLVKRKNMEFSIKKNNRTLLPSATESYQYQMKGNSYILPEATGAAATEISYDLQTDTDTNNYVYILMNRTADAIYNNYYISLKNELNNQTLNIWNTIRGDYNQHGIRSHPQIKLNNKKSNNTMIFNMRY